MKKKIIPATLALMLIFSACSNSHKSSEENRGLTITKTEWILTEWKKSGEVITPPQTEKPITIAFDVVETRIFGSAGCNNYFGSYELNDEKLKSGPAGSTQMFCRGQSMEFEQRFLQMLQEGFDFKLKDGNLILSNGDEQLIFKSQNL